jgi:hypothetical protein
VVTTKATDVPPLFPAETPSLFRPTWRGWNTWGGRWRFPCAPSYDRDVAVAPTSGRRLTSPVVARV